MAAVPTALSPPGVRSRWVLATAAVALVGGAAAAATLAASSRVEHPVAEPALTLLAAWAFVAAGLVAVVNRPGNRTGPLMVAGGLLLLAGTVSSADSAAAFTIGTLLGPLAQAVFAHLLLAFPEGRLHSRTERVLVAVAYLDVTVGQVVMSLFMDYRTVDGCPCPPNELFVLHHDRIHAALMATQRLVGVAVWLGVIAVFAARWRRASPPLRRSLAPVLGTGGVAVTVVGVGLLVEQGWGSSVAGYLGLTALLAVSLVPAGFLIGLLRSRLARAAVGDLVIELGRPMAAGDLRSALSRAIGDPSLELVYRRPDNDTYVDLDGRRVDPPPPGSVRAVTYVERDGRAIAAAIHDATLTDDPSLIQAACAAAGLALENERLQAELRARLDELRASRARIVTAGDVARRRLERNLHDGAQQRLVSLAVMLSLVQARLAGDPEAAGTALAAARAELDEAVTELRELARGLHPALLTDRGLASALRALAGRAPMRVVIDVRLDAATAPGPPTAERLPEAVEAAAYYFVSEAVTNATKHARASEVAVTVVRRGDRLLVTVADDGVGGLDLADGSGLRGLVDRVEALDGHMTVSSPHDRGTTLVADLHCPLTQSRLPERRTPAPAPSLTPKS
jgi:signal transduction histidine kinase